jgi:hypothetical protein
MIKIATILVLAMSLYSLYVPHIVKYTRNRSGLGDII